MIQNMDKYIDAENDYLVINAKTKMIEKLLVKSNHTINEIADFASDSIDFVISIKQKMIDNKS
ncbi:hypothetical protein VB264_05620 [Arcicella aquatica]|uniref:Uncharacterized protein n=1 Tax=Arcicella aquatica TaxID=217141 RepID=A0ABU5QJM6_9BACT|nr:hypothetical protein [Arcicella aquatica]MEA5257257.1 hypothetical protein [Arcicella aquatica]